MPVNTHAQGVGWSLCWQLGAVQQGLCDSIRHTSSWS